MLANAAASHAFFYWSPSVLWISVLAGLLGLDSSAAVQLMLSRPLVAGCLVGAVAGNALSGLSLGCLLELLWVNALQVGAFVPPDLTFASIFTVGASLLTRQSLPGDSPASLQSIAVFFILVSIPLALLGGMLEIRIRYLNVRLGHWIERRIERRQNWAVSLGLTGALGVLFFKDFILTAGSLMLFVPLADAVLSQLPTAFLHGLAWTYWLVFILGLTLFLDLFWNRKFLAPLAGGFGLSWVWLHVFHLSLGGVFPLCVVSAILFLIFFGLRRA